MLSTLQWEDCGCDRWRCRINDILWHLCGLSLIRYFRMLWLHQSAHSAPPTRAPKPPTQGACVFSRGFIFSAIQQRRMRIHRSPWFYVRIITLHLRADDTISFLHFLIRGRLACRILVAFVTADGYERLRPTVSVWLIREEQWSAETTLASSEFI